MYTPDAFKIDDAETIQSFIAANSFATLVTVADGHPVVSHLPLIYDSPGGDTSGEQVTVTGHMAKANSHWRAFDGKSESLAIFSGPDAYISPTWYETKPAVPTWNYAVVHIRGPITALEDEDWILEHVSRLTAIHEMAAAGESEVSVSPDLKSRLVKLIVGFRMDVTSVEAKFKLNQNRSAADRLSAAGHLVRTDQRGAAEIAAMMRGVDSEVSDKN